MLRGFPVKIDKTGRILVPAQYRKLLGLTENTELEMLCTENGLVIQIVKKGEEKDAE